MIYDVHLISLLTPIAYLRLCMVLLLALKGSYARTRGTGVSFLG